MNRVVWFILCTVVGLELLALGLLVPAHLGSVDVDVLDLIGRRGPTLGAEGISLVSLERSGPARLLWEVADRTGAPGKERLSSALTDFETAHPKAARLGGPAMFLERVFEKTVPSTNQASQPFIDLLVQPEAREALLEMLRQSRRPGVTDVLKTRELTNTVLFPPALSPSGQPLEAVILITALLMNQDQFSSAVRNSLQGMLTEATRRGAVQPMEMFYVDILALGRRLNWGQLVHLIQRMDSTTNLQASAALLREKGANVPVIYAAIHFADSPGTVVKYLRSYPATGVKDLTCALRSGATAVRELLDRQCPVYYGTWRERLTRIGWVQSIYGPTAQLVADHPFFGFVMKYGLCVLGVLLLARAATYLSPALVDEIVQQRPLVSGPQLVIALCLLFVVLFFTESLVTRASPATEFPLRVKIPGASAVPRATVPPQTRAMIDKVSMLSLLVFFIMQATIYVICRMKLAEIRRQTLPSRLKLRLLENEEQLFDAGLYFGFVGTVASLILVSVGIIKPSLMAAYSSTSFGIVFVSVLKIFHVRPYKRRLILDAEIAEREPQPA